LDELKIVFKRKGIDFSLVLELLETYRNISIGDLTEISKEEVALAGEVIDDPKDRPIFVFALRMVRASSETFFVTGDQGFFKTKVQKPLLSRVLSTRKALEIIESPDK